MPTKRRRRSRTPNTGPLNPALIDYLLYGRCCTGPELEKMSAEARENYDGFCEFDAHPAEELRQLWTTHKNALFAEFWRRGGKGMPAGWRQFGRPVDDTP